MMQAVRHAESMEAGGTLTPRVQICTSERGGKMGMIERRALQLAVSIATLVPIGAGASGVLLGSAMLNPGTAAPADFDSHFRYLSGLLLAIGLAFASTVPRIETKERRFRLLACIVVAGGTARLLSLLAIGPPSRATIAALVMELAVTPALTLWQRRVARRHRPRMRG